MFPSLKHLLAADGLSTGSAPYKKPKYDHGQLVNAEADEDDFTDMTADIALDENTDGANGETIHKQDSGRRTLDHVRVAPLRYPRAMYEENVFATTEYCALRDFVAEWKCLRRGSAPGNSLDMDGDFIPVQVTVFSVYRREKHHTSADAWWDFTKGSNRSLELANLHDLRTRTGVNELLIDGEFQLGCIKHSLRSVPFEILSIEGYDDDSDGAREVATKVSSSFAGSGGTTVAASEATPFAPANIGTNADSAPGVHCGTLPGSNCTFQRDHIVSRDYKLCVWVQSARAKACNVWYQLTMPAPEYTRYWQPFLWIATFTKHFIDFASTRFTVSGRDRRSVTLQSLRIDMHDWLVQRYGTSHVLGEWLRVYERKDFRHAFVAYLPYVWKEATSVNRDLLQLVIWRESDPVNLESIPRQPLCERRTIVTTFIAHCFQDIYFGQELEATKIQHPAVAQAWRSRMKRMCFAKHHEPSYYENIRVAVLPRPRTIKIGDVVCVRRDDETSWKDAADFWFAYVQDIRERKEKVCLDVLWLYRPSDTILRHMKYPFIHELFLSDHCNCHEANFDAADVIGVLKIEWCPRILPSTSFIRQTYSTEDQSFSTLDNANSREISCEHKMPKLSSFAKLMGKYKTYDTILASPTSEGGDLDDSLLEPMVIDRFDELSKKVHCRALLRRRNVEPKDDRVRSNDLVWTNVVLPLNPTRIYRKCQIRFYSSNDILPKLYEANGQGDHFFISSYLEDGLAIPRDYFDSQVSIPKEIRLAVDTAVPPSHPPLPALSLFSGGGNFDFGLEEGGAISVDHYVEWDDVAAHTIRANSTHSPKVWLGSVDDYLAAVLCGDKVDTVAQLGSVALIIGGSPCQGFSLMQPDNLSEESLRNASKVATMLAFIDLYRPAYAILENVPSMASREVGGQNVFSQVLCALVGMGYQTQQHQLHAINYGNPTTRQRLFIIATAPGLVQPKRPPHTHSQHAGHIQRGLGRIINGERFGMSPAQPTPFKFVTASEATSDLPNIADGHVKICIPFPDHRPIKDLSPIHRLIISSIPRFPGGLGIANVLHDPKATPLVSETVINHQWRYNHLRTAKEAKSWKRVERNGLLPTITTALTPEDAKNGISLHWDQQRLITLQEARRAQGYPDDMVLLGAPAKQWKIVGNSVARGVATALGLSIRDAWYANSKKAVSRVSQPKMERPTLDIIHDLPRSAVAAHRVEIVVVKRTLTIIEPSTDLVNLEASEDIPVVLTKVERLMETTM